MTVLSGQTIRRRVIMTPHVLRQRHAESGMTFGEGPAGYDVRIAEDIDLYPGGFALASTVEHFTMPADVLGRVCDKSTLARMGLAVQNTVIEPGWRGFLTLELTSNLTAHSVRRVSERPDVLRLRAGQPIAQVIFELLDEPAEHPYEGRYQDQAAGPQPARFLSPRDTSWVGGLPPIGEKY